MDGDSRSGDSNDGGTDVIKWILVCAPCFMIG